MLATCMDNTNYVNRLQSEININDLENKFKNDI